MFGRGDRENGKGGVLTPLLVAFALLFQAAAPAHCAPARPANHVAALDCEHEGAKPDRDAGKGAARTAAACCQCVLHALAEPVGHRPFAHPTRQATVVASPCDAGTAPTLRAIAAHPPSQAPPALS